MTHIKQLTKLIVISGTVLFAGSLIALFWTLRSIYSCVGLDASTRPAVCTNLSSADDLVKVLLITTVVGLLVALYGLFMTPNQQRTES